MQYPVVARHLSLHALEMEGLGLTHPDKETCVRRGGWGRVREGNPDTGFMGPARHRRRFPRRRGAG